MLVNLAAGLFILPFFLFSATSGQLADKYEKSRLIRFTKLLEIGIMVLAAVAFALKSLPLMLSTLFLMGTQSSIFGPVKYAILPQHLKEDEIVGGNALVESGTFVSILLGTIAGGLTIALPGGSGWVSGGAIVIAMLGYVASRGIPEAPAADPGLKVDWNPITETWRNIGETRGNRTVFLSILGISWFWFYGAMFLSQFPGYAREVLGGDEHAVTLLLAVFSVGIGIGSLLCEKLSGRHVEIGLVPFGSIGLTLFGLDLWWASPATVAATAASAAPLSIGALLSGTGELAGALRPGDDRRLRRLLHRAAVRADPDPPEPARRSRIIAGNNILNAAFMVVAAGLGAGLLAARASIPQLILVTALLNAGVAIYIYTLVPGSCCASSSGCWCTPCIASRWWVTRTSRGGAGGDRRQPRQLRRCADHHGGQPPADPLRDGPPHLPLADPVLRLSQQPGDPDRTGKGRPGDDGACLRRGGGGARGGELVGLFPEGRITDNGELYPSAPAFAVSSSVPRCRWCRWRCAACGAAPSAARAVRRCRGRCAVASSIASNWSARRRCRPRRRRRTPTGHRRRAAWRDALNPREAPFAIVAGGPSALARCLPRIAHTVPIRCGNAGAMARRRLAVVPTAAGQAAVRADCALPHQMPSAHA